MGKNKKLIWEMFQNTGSIDGSLSENIAKSWIHSREAGVNPNKICLEKNMVQDGQLKDSLHKNKKIIRIVKPVMKELCEQFEEYRLTVTLLDTDLCVLVVQKSHDELLCNTLKISNRPGFCYSEEKIGTTAISMCAKTGKVETISGYEHYCREYHDVFCVAVPIYDENNNICSILGGTGILKNKVSNLDTILAISSKMITNNIKMQNVERQLDTKSTLYGIIFDTISDGMLTVNMEGIITSVNPAGMQILGIDKSCIGKHITESVDFEPTILEVIRTGKGYIDREFRLEGKNGMIHFVKTAIPMKDERGNMIGCLDVFRSITQVKSMVNKLTGAQAKYTISNIIGKCNPIQNIKKMIKIAGRNDSTVLIQGESGTGKEIIAQAIHNHGIRKDGPFIAINCSAIPRDLIESELFGYEKGSFTGALKGGRPGKFEMAHGGTLFFDEIGDMPLDMQSKLLRVLQQKSVVRIGGFKEMFVDVRIIAATNKNLDEMIREKSFREDLYYRINVINIVSPPLREREGDIDLLIDFMLRRHNLINATHKVISDKAREMLDEWEWPGNVRELENAVEYAYCMAENKEVLPEHLPSRIFNSMTKGENNGGFNMHLYDNGVITIKQAEMIAIKHALNQVNGNMTKASKMLGIGRTTLYEKIHKIGLIEYGNE
ncbi:sigma-54 interaction domain-containing protein [Clostridium sp. JNZ X4-2]